MQQMTLGPWGSFPRKEPCRGLLWLLCLGTEEGREGRERAEEEAGRFQLHLPLTDLWEQRSLRWPQSRPGRGRYRVWSFEPQTPNQSVIGYTPSTPQEGGESQCPRSLSARRSLSSLTDGRRGSRGLPSSRPSQARNGPGAPPAAITEPSLCLSHLSPGLREHTRPKD